VVSLSYKSSSAGLPVSSNADLYASDGEIHYLWSYIQGSIMIPETRWQLRRAWGMCERHAFIAVAAEAEFRHGYLHGPAIIYVELMERAVADFESLMAAPGFVVAHRLRTTKPCLMCELGYSSMSRTPIVFPDYIAAGRRLDHIRAMAQATEPFWRAQVCGQCANNGAPALCRNHLRQALNRGKVDLNQENARIRYIHQHLAVYGQSFVWGFHNTETVEDRAALISAVGWCSGWKPWLILME